MTRYSAGKAVLFLLAFKKLKFTNILASVGLIGTVEGIVIPEKSLMLFFNVYA